MFNRPFFKKELTVMKTYNSETTLCIECKEEQARYWGSNFCELCFRKMLSEKLEEDE